MGTVLPMHEWRMIAFIYVVKLCIPKRFRVVVYAAGALAVPLILP
jgi:hypothetical protein